MSDQDYMKTALALAEKGRGFTSPNPMVGAVVVKDGTIVGRGWHHGAGLAHAEVNAIDDAGALARGADIYVTLEPCNHQGRTPPCTRKILDAGIRRVVVAALDPNPYVGGGGVEFLRNAGVEVETGILAREAETLIEDFIWYVKSGKRPFVTVKCASTLDGRLATRTGDSKWITNEKSRAFVHRLRHWNDAILVGAGTLHADDPSLTARIPGSVVRNPLRVILDAGLSISRDAGVLQPDFAAGTLIAASRHASSEKKQRLESLGAKVVILPEKDGLMDWNALLEHLGTMGVLSLLIEGGGRVIASAFEHQVVNKAFFFIAPKVLGGDDGVPVCRGKGPALMKDAFLMKGVELSRFDDDILIQGYFRQRPLKEEWACLQES